MPSPFPGMNAAGYALSIYDCPPEPQLTPAAAEWAAALVPRTP
ncbi:MAG: hypothetical protein JWO38_2721 [Gemmataceae bacterium]|nr:hypothetical protein [Gemmataceae bacterium]